jgi:hypothetical protein
VVTLAYLRRNRTEAELAETCWVSQPTISRAISAVTPLLDKALRGYVPTAEELDASTQYVPDKCSKNRLTNATSTPSPASR